METIATWFSFLRQDLGHTAIEGVAISLVLAGDF